MCDDNVEIAGPGFINLRLRTDWIVANLESARADKRLAVSTAAEPKTYVVDFSSPNVAKPMPGRQGDNGLRET